MGVPHNAESSTPTVIQPDYHRIFDHAPGAYLIVAPDLTIIAANDAYLSMTMTTRTNLIGRHLFANFPGNSADPAVESSVRQIRDSFARAATTRSTVTLAAQKYDIPRPESAGGGFEERWWGITNTPVLAADGTVEYFVQRLEDLTDTIRLQQAGTALQSRNAAMAEEIAQQTRELQTINATLLTTNAALLDAQLRLQATVSAAEIATWVWDIPGDRVIADQNLGRLFGIAEAREQIFPIATYLHYIHPDDRERVSEAIGMAVEGIGFYEAEYRILQENGTVRWVIARGRVEHDPEGQPRRFPGVLLDITDRKQAEAAREELLTREQTARTEAEAAVHARDVFLSIAAHELRTPVTVLKGSVQLLQRRQARGTLEPEYLERALDTLNASTNRLAMLTDDLLDVSRIRTGQLPLTLQSLDLGALIATLVARERDARGTRAAITIAIAPELPPLQADAGRLEQVLTNLIDNAIKYSPADSPVRVVVEPDGNGVRIAVHDDGIGLPAGSTETIFEPFGRATNAVTNSLPGLGLGLYICRSIVEQHGGSISAASAGEGSGTTFTIWLPATNDTTDDSA